MVVLRFWRANSLRCSLLRGSRYGFSSVVCNLSERICLQKYYTTQHDTFKTCYSYVTLAAFRCWNCHAVLDTRPCLFCKNCSLIQSSEQQNFDYFELLNVPDKYDIDTGQLTLNFRKLQNLIHPDKFSNKTEVNIIWLGISTYKIICCELIMYILGGKNSIRIIFFSAQQSVHNSV